MTRNRTTAWSIELLLLAGCARDQLPDGPVWTGSAASQTGVALAVGDLDGDGRAELVVQSENLGTTEFIAGYTPSNETSQVLKVTADAVVPVDGARFDSSAEPVILDDVTGDGLGELVFGLVLYSGLPASGAAPTLRSPSVALKTPCTIEGLDGFCDHSGFWAPDGTATSLDLPWDTAITPSSQGVNYWWEEWDPETAGSFITWLQLSALSPSNQHMSQLSTTEWGLVAPNVRSFHFTRGDLTADGVPDVLIYTSEPGETGVQILYVTGADAVTLDGPSVRLGDIERLVFTTGDFDGDDRPDLAIQARDAVYVFRGPLVGVLSLDDADRVFRSDAVDTDFGEALAAGDLDGDGRDDLVIGEPAWSDGTGRVHVAWGGGL